MAEQNVIEAVEEEKLEAGQVARKSKDRRKDDRRSGMDRRCAAVKSYSGPERRGSEEERRHDMERRRGPGRRRADERRSAEEGEMTDEQFTFIKAIEEYKRVNKRPFPSYTEILEVAIALGYRKVADPQTI